MSNEQIQVVCSEAEAVGLGAVVPAIGDSGARPAVLAGCSSIGHGTFLRDATLDLMAQWGRYFDPNLLVLHNSLDNRTSYAFNGQTLATLEKGIAPTIDAPRRARAHHVKIIFGTDAVADAHGRNADDGWVRPVTDRRVVDLGLRNAALRQALGCCVRLSPCASRGPGLASLFRSLKGRGPSVGLNVHSWRPILAAWQKIPNRRQRAERAAGRYLKGPGKTRGAGQERWR
jgi:hypothetical protein